MYKVKNTIILAYSKLLLDTLDSDIIGSIHSAKTYKSKVHV